MELQNIRALTDTNLSHRNKKQEKSVSALIRSGDTSSVPSLSVNVVGGASSDVSVNVGTSLGVNLALPKITLGGRSSSVVEMTPTKPSFNANTSYDPSPLKYGGININSNYSSSMKTPLKVK